MTLNKKKMVREIGRRTRIRNRDVQAVIEALIEVWTEELVSGGRIELEGFCILETQTINPGKHLGMQRYNYRVILRIGKRLKLRLNQNNGTIIR